MAFQLWEHRCPWQHRGSLLLPAKQYCVKEVINTTAFATKYIAS